MFKKIFFVFILIFFSTLLNTVYAVDIEDFISIDIGEMEEKGYFIDDINDIMEYVALKSSIGEIHSTIIPNQLVAESIDGSLKQVSAEIIVNVERLSVLETNTNPVKLVIGDVKAVSESEFEELCRIVQSEAGGQDIVGKILIANVIFNRIESPKFPNNVHDVIFAAKQFSPVSNGSFFSCTVSEETKTAVTQALNGVDYSNGATYFMARSAANRYAVTWFDTSLTYLFKHGGHEFFK